VIIPKGADPLTGGPILGPILGLFDYVRIRVHDCLSTAPLGTPIMQVSALSDIRPSCMGRSEKKIASDGDSCIRSFLLI